MHPLSCCVTGHRDIPAKQLPFIEQALREEIETAIDGGFRHFLSGFAEGADMIFARLVLEAQARFPDIFLEAALPYPAWMTHRSQADKALLARCQKARAHSEGYSPYCFAIRNQYMVHVSQRVIAVYDGRRKGGTANTLRYAASLDRDIRVVGCLPSPD